MKKTLKAAVPFLLCFGAFAYYYDDMETFSKDYFDGRRQMYLQDQAWQKYKSDNCQNVKDKKTYVCKNGRVYIENNTGTPEAFLNQEEGYISSFFI